MTLKEAIEKLDKQDDEIKAIQQEQDRIKASIINSSVCPFSVGDVVLNDFEYSYSHQGKKICITHISLTSASFLLCCDL